MNCSFAVEIDSVAIKGNEAQRDATKVPNLIQTSDVAGHGKYLNP